MGILDWLGLRQEDQAPRQHGGQETVDRVAGALEGLTVGEARYLAAFAWLLSSVAYADGSVTADEEARMQRILRDFSTLTHEQAERVLLLAGFENFNAGADHLEAVCAVFTEMADDARKADDLVGCLYAVASADEVVAHSEEALIARIARHLGVDEEHLAKVQRAYADFRRP